MLMNEMEEYHPLKRHLPPKFVAGKERTVLMT